MSRGIKVKAQVFKAYMSASFALPANAWTKLPFDTVEYNTAGGLFASNLYTISREGFYRVSTSGGSVTPGATSSLRYATSLYVNGTQSCYTGGNLSFIDTPLVPLCTMPYLKVGDTIAIWMWCVQAITLIGTNGGNSMRWDMDYVGGLK